MISRAPPLNVRRTHNALMLRGQNYFDNEVDYISNLISFGTNLPIRFAVLHLVRLADVKITGTDGQAALMMLPRAKPSSIPGN
jgi:hypothetical protein